MGTLYDLLGALPNDDADGLRVAFRQAVKGAHPDINPGDPDAGLKFRQIVRANEILSDSTQRAAYDHLLSLARLEQEQAAKQAFAGKIYKLASSVMALAGLSAAAVGGYALFVHLSASAAPPAAGPKLATSEQPATAAIAIEQPPSTPTAPNAAADDAPAPVGPPLDITPNEARAYWAAGVAAHRSGDTEGALAAFDQAIQIDPTFEDAYVDRGMVLYRMQQFERAFADMSHAKRLEKAAHAASPKKKPRAAGAENAAKPARVAEVDPSRQRGFPFLFGRP
jgi:curved DNA-binding protein CbpA